MFILQWRRPRSKLKYCGSLSRSLHASRMCLLVVLILSTPRGHGFPYTGSCNRVTHSLVAAWYCCPVVLSSSCLHVMHLCMLVFISHFIFIFTIFQHHNISCVSGIPLLYVLPDWVESYHDNTTVYANTLLWTPFSSISRQWYVFFTPSRITAHPLNRIWSCVLECLCITWYKL